MSLEAELYGAYESDVPSRVIGERLMELLKDLDQVAYVRFASVYREFKDARDFVDELEPILKWDFYEAVASVDHVLTIQTAEQAPWANLLLTVGCRTFS